jgi:ATP-dependent Clp protease adapter protein ClpS
LTFSAHPGINSVCSQERNNATQVMGSVHNKGSSGCHMPQQLAQCSHALYMG